MKSAAAVSKTADNLKPSAKNELNGLVFLDFGLFQARDHHPNYFGPLDNKSEELRVVQNRSRIDAGLPREVLLDHRLHRNGGMKHRLGWHEYPMQHVFSAIVHS